MNIYTEAQRRLQEAHETTALADALAQGMVTERLDAAQAAFIESRDFFFLSTVNGSGEPTVSYKGGGIGVVTVLSDQQLAFPAYDGNGMFLSLGNLSETAHIGLLFMDFETPHRVRVQARASYHQDDALLANYPGAIGIVRAEVRQAFVNCARYIHRYQRRAPSPYVPTPEGEQPHPAWKRLDALQGVLSNDEQARTRSEGGEIDAARYAELLLRGDS